MNEIQRYTLLINFILTDGTIFVSGVLQKEVKENPSSLYLIKSIIKDGERI